MGGRFLHIVLMPEDGGTVRNFRITARGLRAVILSLIGLVLALGTSLTFHLRTFSDAQQLRTLRAENHALQDRVDEMDSAILEITRDVERSGQREREARLLAGLDPVDEETRRLGIGGPFLQVEPASGIASEDLRDKLRDQQSRLDGIKRQLAFQKSSFAEVLNTLESSREKLGRTPTICPVRGVYTLSSGFGVRNDPFTGRSGQHNGIDFRAARGTPIVASANGTVSSVSFNGAYGLTVQIDHGDGIETVYSHLASASVREGEKVVRSQRIGAVGASGRTTGSHLHYEVWERGRPVDPSRYILTQTAIVVD